MWLRVLSSRAYRIHLNGRSLVPSQTSNDLDIYSVADGFQEKDNRLEIQLLTEIKFDRPSSPPRLAVDGTIRNADEILASATDEHWKVASSVEGLSPEGHPVVVMEIAANILLLPPKRYHGRILASPRRHITFVFPLLIGAGIGLGFAICCVGLASLRKKIRIWGRVCGAHSRWSTRSLRCLDHSMFRTPDLVRRR